MTFSKHTKHNYANYLIYKLLCLPFWYQSLVTNLNMDKPLDEIFKAPIEIMNGFTQAPGIPKDGKCITLLKNLLPGTQYVLASSSGSRVSEQVGYIQATLNNITEILSWITLHQTPEHNQANIERSENITKLLEKQFTKIIEILEQKASREEENKQLITEVQEIKDMITELRKENDSIKKEISTNKEETITRIKDLL